VSDKDKDWAGKGFSKRNQESAPPPPEPAKDDDDEWVWK
jgi:hypothetical protein